MQINLHQQSLAPAIIWQVVDGINSFEEEKVLPSQLLLLFTDRDDVDVDVGAFMWHKQASQPAQPKYSY